MHVPWFGNLTSLGRTVFRHNRMDDICPEKLVPTAAHFLCRSLPTRLRMSYRPIFAHGLTSLGRRVFRHNRIDAICLEKPVPTAIHSHYIASSNGALPKLFPTVSLPSTLSSLPHRSFPTGLSLAIFPRFPLRPPCRRFRIAPSPRSSPQPISFPSTLSSLPYAIYHGFPSVHLLFASVSSFPTDRLSPSYFPRFPFRPPCRRFCLAPSARSSPQAISHGFPPSTLSSLPSRSFPTRLSPSYSHDGFPSVHLVVASVSLLPTELSKLYFPGFLSVHFVVVSVSLLPNGALPMLFPMVSHLSSHPSTLCCFRIVSSQWSSPQLFPTISRPSTLSSLPHHSFTTDHGALPKLFPTHPLRPPVVAFRIAPSQRSLPPCRRFVSLLSNGALPCYSHGFPSSTLSSLPSRSFLHGSLFPMLFPTVSLVHPLVSSVSLLPQRSSPKLFPRFPPSNPIVRFRLAPPNGALLYAISYGFIPSVHLLVASVSLLPTGLFASYSHGFPSVHPLVASRIAPSTRSSPQAISHGFLSVHLVVASIRSSQRSSPQAISYGFPSVHPLVTSVSLPRGKCTKREPKHRRCFWEKTCTERP